MEIQNRNIERLFRLHFEAQHTLMHQQNIDQHNRQRTPPAQVAAPVHPPVQRPAALPQVIHLDYSSSGVSYDPTIANPPITQPPHPSNAHADDATVRSTHSQAHFSSTDKELKIPNFSYIDSATDCRHWYDLVLALLAAKSYYNPLMLPNGTINFAATDTACNASLYAMLHPRLDKAFKTSCQNSNCTTGTAILHDIFISFSDTVVNSTRGTTAYAAIHSIVWHSDTVSLTSFHATFNTHLSHIHEAHIAFPLQALKMCWITALPPSFIEIKAAFKQGSNLPDKWKEATTINMLYQVTKHHADLYNISIVPIKAPPTKDPRLAPPGAGRGAGGRGNGPGGRGGGGPGGLRETDHISETFVQDRKTAIPETERYAYPPAHPTSSAFRRHLQDLRASGKSTADLITMFQPAYTDPGCFVCRIKNTHRSFHESPACKILNQIYNYPKLYCRNALSSPSTPPPSPTYMCYDSGTTPKTLCDDASMFSEIGYFASPQQISLGDGCSTITALGQGTIDIVINGLYRIQQHAIMTNCTPVALMASSDHIRYKDCAIIGTNNLLRVIYPTFSFTITGDDRFEFPITPGKTSTLPILWHPEESNLRSAIKIDDTLSVLPLLESAILPTIPTTTSPTNHTYNLHTHQKYAIPPSSSSSISLGLALSFLPKFCCHLQSSQPEKYSLHLGPVDPTLHEDIQVFITNLTDQPLTFQIGHPFGLLSITLAVSPPLTSPPKRSSPSLLRRPTPLHMIAEESLDTTVNTLLTAPSAHLPPPPVSPPSPSLPPSIPTPALPTVPRPILHTTPVVEDVPLDDVPVPLHPDAEDLFLPDTTNVEKLISPTDQFSPTVTPPPTSVPPETHHTPSTPPSSPAPAPINTSIPIPSPPCVPTVPTVLYRDHEIFDFLDNSEEDTNDINLSTVQSNLYNPNHVPRIPVSDRVSSTEPAIKLVTTEFLQKSLGFRNIEKVLKNIKTLTKDSILVRDTGRDPIASRGETATLPKKNRNKIPVPRPARFGDVIHYDIGYGNGRAIGGIHYVLFLVDRKSRQKFCFGLKDLSPACINRQLKKFIRKLGRYPGEMIADRDFKLIGTAVDDLLEPHTSVSGAPSGRQNQNGLSEINWRYICDMARNYMAEHLLPPEFWYFAIAYSTQASNYLPIKTDVPGVLTTPFFEAYGEKPDYRNLSPLFSTSYVKIYESGEGPTLVSQTIKAIIVGNDEKSDGKLFYNPSTKSLLGSSDYRLDTSHPSGPLFGLAYNGNFEFHLLDDSLTSTPPCFDLLQEVYISPQHESSPGLLARVLNIPFHHSDAYSLQVVSTGDIIDVLEGSILPTNPNAPLPDTSSLILTLPWIKHDAKTTLFLPESMVKPQQGLLQLVGSEWYFHAGRTLKSKARRNNPRASIHLPNFSSTAEKLFYSKQLVSGWSQFSSFLQHYEAAKTLTYISRRITYLGTSDPASLTDGNVQATLDNVSKPSNTPSSTPTTSPIAYSRRVSASGLESHVEPKLHEHHKLSPTDKTIWDKAYLEEYLGLHVDTQTWEYITEEQYQLLRPVVGNALPSMALSKIKKVNGIPDRAKYRIVVLGNLDPHDWSSSDCFAPVISPVELRLLIALAAKRKRIPKTGDVSQAFCQSVLPEDEQYVIRPPKACPLTPSATYLLLKKTLYGLKRSPRHWYNTCRKALASLGLFPCPNAPCIFTGTIIDGEPPIYLGLFVDDFVYFSDSDSVEAAFEKGFASHFTTDFQGDITQFLGINFTCVKEENDLTIYMNQPNDARELIAKAGLAGIYTNSTKTPYRSGHPVDSVPDIDMAPHDREPLNKILQEYVGSLNWLATQTRPDLSTITNIIAQYNNKCSPGHIDAAKYAIRYLIDTADLGIKFSSKANNNLESFVQFPIEPSNLTALTDSNWGPQDQSVPKPNDPPILLDLFKSRSIAGFVIWLCGPLDWSAKRQTYTARSSAEAEIGAVDQCTKQLQYITNILLDLGILHEFSSGPITIYNDNAAAVQWSHNMSTKGLRYIQIRENAVRENVQKSFIKVEHIAGKRNTSDMFTKEDKEPAHYIEIRDTIQDTPPKILLNIEKPLNEPGHSLEVPSVHHDSLFLARCAKGGVGGQTVPLGLFRCVEDYHPLTCAHSL